MLTQWRVALAQRLSSTLAVASLAFVVWHVRIKYGCPSCLKAETVHVETPAKPPVILTAPLPPSDIEKCAAEPGLLAQVIVNKYMDHLPLALQEAIFTRPGIALSRKKIPMNSFATKLRRCHHFVI